MKCEKVVFLEMDRKIVLLAPEVEAYIDALENFDFAAIGSPRWFLQHERLSKLTMQAALDIIAQEEEVVKEMFLTSGKIPILIHELVLLEIWKEKIFQELLKMKFDPPFRAPVYIVLYHEITLLTLLETCLFHQELLESADDAIIDLIDYCFRKVISLTLGKEDEGKVEELVDYEISTEMQEVVKQEKTLAFELPIKAISILSYISEHLPSMPPSVTHRLLCVHDLPLMLAAIISNSPWIRREADGSNSKYYNGKWQKVDHEETMQLTKTEGQVWLTLLRLLLDPECQKKYDLNGFKKERILKIRSYLHDHMLDQLPILIELRRFLEHLSLQELPSPKPSLIMEQVSAIRDCLLKQGKGKWKIIARKQASTFFSPSKEEALEQARRLSDTYNLDVLENFIQEPPKCAVCGSPAAKRCSRCKNEWYCRRECQVQHWPKHKPACQMLTKC